MSLDHAILGFLNYHPLSGYDLKKMFDHSVRHFWSADQSQIYRTLMRLYKRGWVAVNVIEQTDRPDRKEYSITPAGRVELRTWLEKIIEHNPPRSPELIQVFFSAQRSNEQIITQLEQYIAELRQVEAVYNQVPQQAKPYMEMIPSPRDHFFWLLTLECGKKSVHAQIEWMESVIRRLKAGDYTLELTE
ncbi:MAG TPA: PadR family transcriptional regulator [Anaerolineaceae bacterium]